MELIEVQMVSLSPWSLPLVSVSNSGDLICTNIPT